MYICPTNNIAELKPWYRVYVDPIGTYTKSTRKQHPGGAIIKNDGSLTYMKIIDPAMGWFEIFKVPTFYLDKVMRVLMNTLISHIPG